MGVGLIVAVQKLIGKVKLKFDKEIQLFGRRTAVCVVLMWLRCDIVLGVVMKLENSADRDISVMISPLPTRRNGLLGADLTCET